MIRKAELHGISRDQITVAGHSLGGTLAEIEASEFKLRGATFNAYGAADLGYGVPAGGTQIKNYVMACDVVSAASRHFGEVIPLASDADVQSLEAGRYLDAAPGARAPNPFLTMRLSDHGVTLFHPQPGSHQLSVLDPAVLARYARNYAEHKAAFDSFRNDVYTERADVALALRHADNLDPASVWTRLPPNIQQQMTEWHASLVDQPIHAAVERNTIVVGIEQGLDQTGAGLREAGQSVRQTAAVFAQHARDAGQRVQQGVDTFAQRVQHAPLDPLTRLETVIAAKVAGYTARAEAEGFAQTSRLAGQVVHASAQMAATQTEAVRQTIDRGAHFAGSAATEIVHAAEKASLTAYEIGHRSAVQAKASGARALLPFSDPGHPQHAMYAHLQKLFPPGTSPERLHQATAACHEGGMNAPADIGDIYGGESSIVFLPLSVVGHATSVDLSRSAPSVQQTMQQVQQYDQQQAQMRARFNAQAEMHVQHGPVR
jgi:hypothetical protein